MGWEHAREYGDDWGEEVDGREGTMAHATCNIHRKSMLDTRLPFPYSRDRINSPWCQCCGSVDSCGCFGQTFAPCIRCGAVQYWTSPPFDHGTC